MKTIFKVIGKIYYPLFLIYLAILPVSNTIALRNLILVMLTFCVLVSAVFFRDFLEISPLQIWKNIPIYFKLWSAFLLLFPLWAIQRDVALQNLGGQWIELILAALVGWGAVMIKGARGPSLSMLGLASAFPIGLHLLLYVGGMLGLLSTEFYADPTLQNVWRSIFSPTSNSVYPALHMSDWSAGFRGIEPMHGNLGYPGDQAIALFFAALSLAWLGGRQKVAWISYAGILLCFLSVFVAQSRGGILFSILLLLMAGIIYFFKIRVSNKVSPSGALWQRSARSKISLVMGILVLVAIALQFTHHDGRWKSMMDKVSLGLFSDNPIQLICEGPSLEYENNIRKKFSDAGPAYADEIIEGLKIQDGGRILLMRVGSQMALEEWRGLDGSRQSYKKLIEEKCGHTPVLDFAHAHQGWIDLTLALGWGGALLFALVMGSFLTRGWQSLQKPDISHWAFALFLITAFWIVRGFADSIYREHNLEMQFVVISYLYARMIFEDTLTAQSMGDK